MGGGREQSKKTRSVILIPGFIVAMLTFPGIIVHEFAHKLFCSLTGTRVLEVS